MDAVTLANKILSPGAIDGVIADRCCRRGAGRRGANWHDVWSGDDGGHRNRTAPALGVSGSRTPKS